MKIGFIIPILDDYDVELAYKNIDKACKDSGVRYNIIFALNNKLNILFTKIRNNFVENNTVKAFMTDRPVNEHKLITLAMKECEDYDAVIIYSGKEETNVDVMKAFITSWKAGNKIVYLKKVYRGFFAKFWQNLKNAFYKFGVLMLGIFKDICAENDIQLLDNDVVKTINQLPNKNQMLRTLDSLIYYNTDIIHLEVDPNEYINPIYEEKDNAYVRNNVIAYSSFALSLAFALTSILLLCFEVKIHFLFHVVFWCLFLITFFLYIVFATKSILNVRVGKEVSLSELNSIQSKTEYYNFNQPEI